MSNFLTMSLEQMTRETPYIETPLIEKDIEGAIREMGEIRSDAQKESEDIRESIQKLTSLESLRDILLKERLDRGYASEYACDFVTAGLESLDDNQAFEVIETLKGDNIYSPNNRLELSIEGIGDMIEAIVDKLASIGSGIMKSIGKFFRRTADVFTDGSKIATQLIHKLERTSDEAFKQGYIEGKYSIFKIDGEVDPLAALDRTTVFIDHFFCRYGYLTPYLERDSKIKEMIESYDENTSASKAIREIIKYLEMKGQIDYGSVFEGDTCKITDEVTVTAKADNSGVNGFRQIEYKLKDRSPSNIAAPTCTRDRALKSLYKYLEVARKLETIDFEDLEAYYYRAVGLDPSHAGKMTWKTVLLAIAYVLLWFSKTYHLIQGITGTISLGYLTSAFATATGAAGGAVTIATILTVVISGLWVFAVYKLHDFLIDKVEEWKNSSEAKHHINEGTRKAEKSMIEYQSTALNSARTTGLNAAETCLHLNSTIVYPAFDYIRDCMRA